MYVFNKLTASFFPKPEEINPNLSLLLGIHSAQHPGTQLDFQKPDVIRRKLEEVQQLRRDIEDLRTTMSDRYAQDMGENCVTQ